MPSDSSLTVYGCPFCRFHSRSEEECRDHITDSVENGHQGVNGHTMDQPLRILTPEVPDFPFGEWEEVMEDYAESVANSSNEVPVSRVKGTTEEHTELPYSYTLFELVRQGYTPVDTAGRPMERHVKDSWEDLTDKARDTLLAVVYYPDLDSYDLVEEGLSGYTSAGTTNNYKNRYLWMLAHPDVDTPVHPPDSFGSKESEVSIENSTEELLDSMERVVPGEDSAAEEAEGRIESESPEPDLDEEFWSWLRYKVRASRRAIEGLVMAGYDSKEELDKASMAELREVPGVGDVTAENIKLNLIPGFGKGGGAEAPSSPPEPQGECAEEEAPEEFAEPVFVLGEEMGFEALCAFIETERYEEARELYDMATGKVGVSLVVEDDA